MTERQAIRLLGIIKSVKTLRTDLEAGEVISRQLLAEAESALLRAVPTWAEQ